jgi:hypothetical protein
MKLTGHTFLVLIVANLYLFACSSNKQISNSNYRYIPDDQQLHDTIVKLDGLFFAAYNTCALNLETYASFYADSIEFYHDKGGLMNNKEAIVASTKKFVCGKVTRTLIKGSIEVYPIKDYGAIEMGLHRFQNSEDASSVTSRAGKFIIIWQHKNNQWKITKVVSLH